MVTPCLEISWGRGVIWKTQNSGPSSIRGDTGGEAEESRGGKSGGGGGIGQVEELGGEGGRIPEMANEWGNILAASAVTTEKKPPEDQRTRKIPSEAAKAISWQFNK